MSRIRPLALRLLALVPTLLPGTLLLGTVAAGPAQAQDEEPDIDILLVTGQSSRYHNWQVSSPIIERLLDDTGLFDVDVLTTPAQGQDLSGFAPQWSNYDAIVLDYDGDEWPAATRAAFEQYLSAGGGLVLVHAADNGFPDWPEFQRMAGVGGWRGRTESAGPMLRWRDGGAVLDTGPGVAQHPPQHDFLIVTRAPAHPIMSGLPEVWVQANDELYSQLRGPAENVTILATAPADPSMPAGTGQNEPMLMAIRYGDGRVFHTTLGHVSPRDDASVATMRSVGFIVTLQRGTEWAATGRVTEPVPADFTAADTPSLRAR
jgi:uncharacterized protein